MKRLSIILLFAAIINVSWSQENMVTISGGYAFANIEDIDENGTGYRLNGLYEFNATHGMIAHGFAFGYIHVSALEDEWLFNNTITINSFPIYYAPKAMFGKDKFKAFVKGVLGMQIAGLKREGVVSLSNTDFGFYGGGGGGIMFYLKENIFINAEYEIAWASNGWYVDGWMNSIMGGIGFRF